MSFTNQGIEAMKELEDYSHFRAEHVECSRGSSSALRPLLLQIKF